MSTAIPELRPAIPTGTWQLDSVHSTVGFEIEYLGGTFRGQFRDVDAVLASTPGGTSVSGSAGVASIDVKDENLAAHLQSPDFFDAERHPELRFESTDVRTSGADVAATGDLTIKGTTLPVHLHGTVTPPVSDLYGRERIGLRLETAVDRTAFGVSWNAPLPGGESALSDEVRIVTDLYFVKEA